MIQQPGDLHRVLQEVNPLGLREESRLMVFKKPSDCILELLKIVYEMCPLGYVDVPLLMLKLQDAKPKYVYNNCLQKEILIIPTWQDCDERNEKLLWLIDAMTWTTGIYVSKTDMQLGLFYFQAYLDSLQKQFTPNKLNYKTV